MKVAQMRRSGFTPQYLANALFPSLAARLTVVLFGAHTAREVTPHRLPIHSTLVCNSEAS
jgi:hypothetical protein